MGTWWCFSADNISKVSVRKKKKHIHHLKIGTRLNKLLPNNFHFFALWQMLWHLCQHGRLSPTLHSTECSMVSLRCSHKLNFCIKWPSAHWVSHPPLLAVVDFAGFFFSVAVRGCETQWGTDVMAETKPSFHTRNAFFSHTHTHTDEDTWTLLEKPGRLQEASVGGGPGCCPPCCTHTQLRAVSVHGWPVSVLLSSFLSFLSRVWSDERETLLELRCSNSDVNSWNFQLGQNKTTESLEKQWAWRQKYEVKSPIKNPTLVQPVILNETSSACLGACSHVFYAWVDEAELPDQFS